MSEANDGAEDTLPLVKGVDDSADDQQKRRSTLLALVLLVLLGLFAFNEITKSGTGGRGGYQLSSGVIESASAYDVAPAHGEESEVVDSRSFRNEKKIVVLLSSGRDAESCARAIIAARDLAFRSNRVHFRVYEEIVVNHEDSCLQVFCDLRPRDCKVLLRSERLQVARRDVSGALGASVALHVLEGMVERKAFEDDFYLSVDTNIEFTKHWDLTLLKQWYSIGNSRAILSVAPPAVETKGMNKGIFFLQCSARIHSKDKDPVVEFNPPEPKILPKGNGVAGALVATFPVLQAQYSERFHFGLVSSLLSVRSDPHLHQLVVGYEYMRATRFWTKGFDFYAPMQDILYYRYEQPLAPHEKGESNSIIDRSSRRIRRLLGLPLSSPLWEYESMPESDIYGPGSNRSLEAWREFSAINDSDRLNESTTNHFAANCDRTLHYVHYD